MDKEKWFGDRGFDFAQFCLNGHLVNSASTIHPQLNQNFCHKCGAKTITTCQRCNNPIKGDDRNVAKHVPGNNTLEIPLFCMDCGAPFPWTESKLGAARELVYEVGGLTDQEKEIFYKSIEDIAQETPRIHVAVVRFQKYIAKTGAVIGGAIRDIVVDIASETAKKLLGI